MKKVLLSLTFGLVNLFVFGGGVNDNAKRAAEIQQLMWQKSGKEFSITTTPEKWNKESAVIIAKDTRLSYHKAPIVSNLKYGRFIHERVKLLSNSAIEEYSEFSIPGSGSIGKYSFSFYAGFKVIKPSGEETIISLDDMVKENAELNNLRLDIFKLAIPDLEVGDIIDYYTVEERVISLAASLKYHNFDPAIFELNDNYPIMKQRIAFDVLRRCFINLKTFNGAPEFKLTKDEENDRNRYELVDVDRERVDDVLWLYKYREIPTVKFKVTYASPAVTSMASRITFLGEPGVLKSKVSKSEIKDFLKYMVSGSSSNYYELNTLFKKKYKSIKNKEEIAKKAFYALRYITQIKNKEKEILQGGRYNNQSSGANFFGTLSSFYKNKKIKHDILVGIPRNISDLDDLILENELTYVLKVTEGDEPVYISYFDDNAYYGELNTDLQGATVYRVNGYFAPSVWKVSEVELPVEPSDRNKSVSEMSYVLDVENDNQLNLTARKSIIGAGQDYYQRYLTDFYTFQEEENKSYPLEVNPFLGVSKKAKSKMIAKKGEILENRKKDFAENMEALLRNDMDVEFEEVENFEVEQTGRFDDKPEFIFSYSAKVKGPVRKVGANYILEIGKLIEEQIQLNEEQKERDFNVYMGFARSFEYNIEVNIPEGYEVQGLGKLNVDITNQTGGFTSQASIVDNKIVLKTSKYYSSNYEPAENWPLMWDFLSAAEDFNSKQVLLKKI